MANVVLQPIPRRSVYLDSHAWADIQFVRFERNSHSSRNTQTELPSRNIFQALMPRSIIVSNKARVVWGDLYVRRYSAHSAHPVPRRSTALLLFPGGRGFKILSRGYARSPLASLRKKRDRPTSYTSTLQLAREFRVPIVVAMIVNRLVLT